MILPSAPYAIASPTTSIGRLTLTQLGKMFYRHKTKFAALTLLVSDIAAIMLASHIAAVWVGRPWAALPLSRMAAWRLAAPIASLFPIIIAYLLMNGRYTERAPFWAETRLLVGASLCGVGTAFIGAIMAEDVDLPYVSVLALLMFPLLATGGNRLAKVFLMASHCWSIPVVIFGAGPSAIRAEVALRRDRLLGYRFVHRIDPAHFETSSRTGRFRDLLDGHNARCMLIALEPDIDLQRQVIEGALRERVSFSVATTVAYQGLACNRAYVLSHELTLLTFGDGFSQSVLRALKIAFDFTVAASLLLLLLPLFAFVAALIRVDGGPAFFGHQRVGVGGRLFKCLKFRTMVVDGERVLHEALARDPALAAEWTATRKLVHDPRVTSIGCLLRKTSLDELPQLINVLRLEMSLVGPRPIVVSEIPFYGDGIAQYYSTRPGLTGLWQVSGRSNTSYAKRVELDVWYVNNWTIWHDIIVLAKTIPAVLRREGAH